MTMKQNGMVADTILGLVVAAAEVPAEVLVVLGINLEEMAEAQDWLTPFLEAIIAKVDITNLLANQVQCEYHTQTQTPMVHLAEVLDKLQLQA